FGTLAGNVGLDVQFDIIIAQAVGERLTKYSRAVQRGLVACCDVVIDTNREGDAQSGQLLNRLLFVLLCLVCIQTDDGLAVHLRQAEFLFHQFGVVGAVRGVNQTLHGEALVFTAHRVDGVESLVVLGQIQSIVPRQAERFVCNRGVPVGIFGTVLSVLVKVEVDLIGVFVRRFFYQIVIELVVLVAADGLEVGLGQVNVVELAGLVQLEGNIDYVELKIGRAHV